MSLGGSPLAEIEYPDFSRFAFAMDEEAPTPDSGGMRALDTDCKRGRDGCIDQIPPLSENVRCNPGGLRALCRKDPTLAGSGNLRGSGEDTLADGFVERCPDFGGCGSTGATDNASEDQRHSPICKKSVLHRCIQGWIQRIPRFRPESESRVSSPFRKVANGTQYGS